MWRYPVVWGVVHSAERHECQPLHLYGAPRGTVRHDVELRLIIFFFVFYT